MLGSGYVSGFVSGHVAGLCFGGMFRGYVSGYASGYVSRVCNPCALLKPGPPKSEQIHSPHISSGLRFGP